MKAEAFLAHYDAISTDIYPDARFVSFGADTFDRLERQVKGPDFVPPRWWSWDKAGTYAATVALDGTAGPFSAAYGERRTGALVAGMPLP